MSTRFACVLALGLGGCLPWASWSEWEDAQDTDQGEDSGFNRYGYYGGYYEGRRWVPPVNRIGECEAE
jgi:hypothetical protein